MFMDGWNYIFQGEPNSDKAWKELGMGNLTLKSREGVEKGTKDAKATVVVRNEVSSCFLSFSMYNSRNGASSCFITFTIYNARN